MIIENESLKKIKRIGKTYKKLEPLLFFIPISLIMLFKLDQQFGILLIVTGFLFIIIFRIAFLTIKQNAIVSMMSVLANKTTD